MTASEETLRGRRLGLLRDYLSITALTAGDGVNNILMPLLLADAGYSAAAIGPLVAVLGVASLVSRFPVGAFYRPTRARWLLIVSLVVAAGCSVLYPWVVASAPLFVAIRVLQGLAAGTATTVNLAFFIDSQPAGRSRARAMGLYAGGMAAGYTLGNLIGGVAGDLLGYPGGFAVGAMFWVVSLCQALVSASPSIAVPDAAAARARPTEESRPRGVRAMLRALRDPAVVGVASLSFQLDAIHHLSGVFFPLLARGAGLGLAEIGLVRSIYSLVNAVTRPISSPFVARLGAGRASFCAFVFQAAVIACIPAVAFGGLPAFILVFVLSGGGRAVGFTANAISLAQDIPESRLSRGLASSLFNAAKDVGTIAGPLIGSALVPLVGLESMFVAAAALLVLFQVAVTGWVRRSDGRACGGT